MDLDRLLANAAFHVPERLGRVRDSLQGRGVAEADVVVAGVTEHPDGRVVIRLETADTVEAHDFDADGSKRPVEVETRGRVRLSDRPTQPERTP